MSEQNEQVKQAGEMELREPTANSVTTPAWPFILLVFIFWLGMDYFNSYGGGFSKNVFAKNLSQDPPQLGLPPEMVQMIKGKTVYQSGCVACHQPNGKGVPGQFPPLAGSDWVNDVGPNRMIRLVLDGVNGPINVNGNDFNAAMVPWRPTLSDEQIANVISFVRNQSEWGNSGSYVTPAQVKAIRDVTSPHANTPYTSEELLALPHLD